MLPLPLTLAKARRLRHQDFGTQCDAMPPQLRTRTRKAKHDADGRVVEPARTEHYYGQPKAAPSTTKDLFTDLVFMSVRALEQQNRALGFDFNQHGTDAAPEVPAIAVNCKQLGKLKTQDSRMDGDCRTELPIRGAVDWGSKISTLTTAQIHSDVRQYRFLNGSYVKHPKLINDLADGYCKYYEYHIRKEFHFIEDTEWGNARKPDADLTYNQQFAERLKSHGWKVRHFNQGRVPSYAHRYHLAHELLGEEDERQLAIRFNKVNCKDVLTAMSLAPVKQDSRGEIAKDKSSEKKVTVPGQEATHFTDTVDLHFLSIDKHVARATPHASGLIIVSV